MEEVTKEEDWKGPLQVIADLSDKLFSMALDEAEGDEAVSALCIASGRAAGLGGAELADAVRAFCQAFELGAQERVVELSALDFGPSPVGVGD